MDREEAIPVCTDCHCVMYKKKISVQENKWMAGWSCIECHKTIWDEVV